MSITDKRLKQIAELGDEIEKKIAWIKKKKDELEEKTDPVKNMPQDLKDMMSGSASRSSRRRGQGATIDIGESATRDEEILDKLYETIDREEKKLNELKKEKQALEDYKEGA